jgi:hypothetical protein
MDGEPVYPPDDLERYLIRLTRLNVEELLAIDAAYRAAELQRTIDPGGVLRAAGNGERDGSRIREVRVSAGDSVGYAWVGIPRRARDTLELLGTQWRVEMAAVDGALALLLRDRLTPDVFEQLVMPVRSLL